MIGTGVEQWSSRLAAGSAVFGRRVEVDGMALLGERLALDGPRQSATRVLRCADDWVAVTLARDWDREAAEAWIGVGGTWAAVTAAVADRTAADLVTGAELLGLAVGVMGERKGAAVGVARFGAAERPMAPARLRVLDLSALWAGPLCGALLAEAGADVAKVESSTRPDASRQGNPGLFDRLNGAKRSVVLDLDTAGGREELTALVRAADVVVESSRPRALEHMGIVAADLLTEADQGPAVWVSITGHGRTSNRAGFGDDAAFAGGLVTWNDGVPDLWGDAAADPLTGLVAAAVAAEAVAAGERVLLDVALAGVAADVAPSLPDAPPATRPALPSGRARPLGADTVAVVREWVGR